MPNNVHEFGTVLGEAFSIKRPNEGQADDKTYFTVKSWVSGKFVSCTLWDSSHGHIQLENGMGVVVHGKVQKKQSGDKVYTNMSVSSIGLIPMDKGVRSDAPKSSGEGSSDDEPDVL